MSYATPLQSLYCEPLRSPIMSLNAVSFLNSVELNCNYDHLKVNI